MLMHGRFGYMPVHTNKVYYLPASPSAWTCKGVLKMIQSTTLSLHIIRPFGRRILKEIFKPAAGQWIWLAFRGSLMGANGQAVRVGVQTWPHGSAQVRLTSHNNDLLDAASFSECPFLHLPSRGSIACYHLWSVYQQLRTLPLLSIIKTSESSEVHQHQEVGIRIQRSDGVSCHACWTVDTAIFSFCWSLGTHLHSVHQFSYIQIHYWRTLETGLFL